MNVLCIGARVIGPELAFEIMRSFLTATYAPQPRHAQRVARSSISNVKPSKATTISLPNRSAQLLLGAGHCIAPLTPSAQHDLFRVLFRVELPDCKPNDISLMRGE